MNNIADVPLRHCRDRKGGFLLAEVLASFTISAFVLVGLVTTASMFLSTMDRSVSKLQDADEFSRTVESLTRDISGLSRARWNGIEPQPFVFKGGPNSLYFAHVERSKMHVVAIRETVFGAITRLERSDAILPSEATSFDGLAYGKASILGTGRTRLRFRYLKGSTGGAAEQALQSWSSGTSLPAAVIIQVAERNTGRLLSSISIPIIANADIGCIKLDEATPATSATPTAEDASNGESPQLVIQAQGVKTIVVGDPRPSDRFCGRSDIEINEDRIGTGSAKQHSGDDP